MAYSVDLRERVVKYVLEGHTQKEAAKIFCVGEKTIRNWLALLAETDSLEKRPLDRTAPIFESKKLCEFMEENPNALLADIAEHFGGSITGAFYALKREKITYKKEIFYRERCDKERQEFEAQLAKIPEGTHVVYIDECGVQKEMNSLYGRAKRGKRVYQETAGKRVKRDNIIAGYCNGIILALTIFAWSCKAEWFLMWLEHNLIPLLEPGSVIVLDNASFHSKKLVPNYSTGIWAQSSMASKIFT